MFINPAKSRSENLSSHIKKTIGYRILICFLLAITVVLVFAANEIASSSSQLEKNLDEQCHELESFIISQIMIKNDDAIQLKLDSLNQTQNGTKFLWRNEDRMYSSNKLHWRFPLSWVYSYLVRNVDGSELGTLVITGPLFNNSGIFSALLTKFGLLLLFFSSIFFVLNPLSKRIPQRLFITPINNLLLLLRKGQSEMDPKNLLNLPDEINEIREKITNLLKEAEIHSREVALGLIATQVAHDIRSPLLVLKRILNDLSSLPEKKRIDARNAVQRVTDIANNLLTQYKHEKNQTIGTVEFSLEPIAMMLESIVSEKRIQISNSDIELQLEIQPNAYDAFIHVDIVGFKRVFSNIINNAIDAVKDKKGLITLTLRKKEKEKEVFITLKDNGCGIPEEMLLSVLKEGTTFGKKEGSGLGLPYTVTKISEWHGDYSLTSELGEGTQLDIILPEACPAEWFSHQIIIQKHGEIIVLDDDDYLHKICDERFHNAFLKENDLKLFHFRNSTDFIQFCQGKQFTTTTFLLDYELEKKTENGLDLANMFGIGTSTTLVTSSYEDTEVRENCKILGIKIIPKSFAEFTPIHVFTVTDIVFVDDEEIITDIWKESAESAGKSISVFNDPRDFMHVAHMYPKETFIYMDSSLGSVKGEYLTKILHENGFFNLILATGYSKEHFKNTTWIKDIIGKEPPWG